MRTGVSRAGRNCCVQPGIAASFARSRALTRTHLRTGHRNAAMCYRLYCQGFGVALGARGMMVERRTWPPAP